MAEPLPSQEDPSDVAFIESFEEPLPPVISLTNNESTSLGGGSSQTGSFGVENVSEITPNTLQLGPAEAAQAVIPTELSLNPQTEQQSSFSSGQYFKQKYNELFHDVEIYLDNSGNLNALPSSRYFINPAAVFNLTISDYINSWVSDGSFTFMYMPEDVDSKEISDTGQTSSTIIKGAQENAAVLKAYQFRNDGFDLLRIMIATKSKADSNNLDSTGGLIIDDNDPNWCLSYLFSVYEVEDVNDVPDFNGNASSYMKCMKLKIRDVRFQILNTTNLEYSTASSPYTNEQRKIPTGLAMSEVLNETLADTEKGGTPEFIQIAGSNWDLGQSEIFYTSPAGSSALDDLEYLYAHHVSSKKLESDQINDICLLHTKRSSQPTYLEDICLTSIVDLFDKATEGENPGELQLEHFFVTSLTNESSSPTNISKSYKAPIGGPTTLDRDLKTFKYGQIMSFSFVEMDPDINSNVFISKPVYSVDIGARSFKADFSQHTVKNARKAITNSYISKLYKEGSGEELFLPNIHKTKEKINIFPEFSLYGDDPIIRQKKGIGDLLYTGLFQNACICFKTLGLPLRQSGTFIGIDKTDGCPDNDYNNKLYGQYFVARVDHIFEAGTYVNVIYAIKLHRFKPKEIQFGDTI